MTDEYKVIISFRRKGNDINRNIRASAISPDFAWYTAIRELMRWQAHYGAVTIVQIQCLIREDDEWLVYREVGIDE